jgi:hypothetical protein
MARRNGGGTRNRAGLKLTDRDKRDRGIMLNRCVGATAAGRRCTRRDGHGPDGLFCRTHAKQEEGTDGDAV